MRKRESVIAYNVIRPENAIMIRPFSTNRGFSN